MLNRINSYENLIKTYYLASPFPHCIVDNFFEEDIAKKISSSFDKEKFIGLNHFNEKKKWTDGLNVSPEFISLFNYLNSNEVISILEKITGIKDLIADTEMLSGGAHCSTKGGYLNIHADFTSHPYKKHWKRRINLLIYFSEKWEDSWGGHLELWNNEMTECCVKIAPKINRAVIFNTDQTSYHGHPEPMKCPDGVLRKSIAMYYYTFSNEPGIATNYKSRPDDSLLKAVGIYLDKKMVYLYHFLKGAIGVKDNIFTKIKNYLYKQ